jgi:hypothetical protein
MGSTSTQIAAMRGMGFYEPFHQISSWGHAYRDDGSLNIGPSTIVQVDAGLDNKVMINDIFLLVSECQSYLCLPGGLTFLTDFV